MLSDYFYHKTLKTITYGFGTLFNNIYIQKQNVEGEVVSLIKVPIKYGPTQKFLSRLRQSPDDLNNPIEMTLPRMSFEITSLLYDSRRKTSTTMSFMVANEDGSEVSKMYSPVPYTVGYNLYIMSKLIDDVWQIVEQIIPYFTPSHTLTLNVVPSINEKRDVAYTLNSVDIQEDYEGDFSERVTYIYTLSFTSDIYLFKPADASQSVQDSIIENVSFGYVIGGPNSVTRDLTYSIGAVATQSYSNNNVTTLNQDIDLVQFNFNLTDTSSLSKGDFITIDEETMKVIDINGNSVTVRRGEYGTDITKHVLGTNVQLITVSDNSLIPLGDEFGISIFH